MVQAMVADLPDPVMPSKVWNRSPASIPAASWSIAWGWSPAGSKSDTTRNRVSSPGPDGLSGELPPVTVSDMRSV